MSLALTTVDLALLATLVLARLDALTLMSASSTLMVAVTLSLHAPILLARELAQLVLLDTLAVERMHA